MTVACRSWRRVSPGQPCRVCEHPDWCLFSADGDAAICARVESSKRCGEAGWLHKLRDDGAWRRGSIVHQVAPSAPRTAGLDFGQLAEQYHKAVNPFALVRLASELGVSRSALWRLGIGFDGEAWTFPMRDCDGRVVGIRRRFDDGRKLSVKGGHEGLFVPEQLPDENTLFIAEGATDTAALLSLGISAIGRPSCTGGTKLVSLFVARRDLRETIMVADRDLPGMRGAGALADVLVRYCPAARVISPAAPHKDIREWVRHGATRGDIVRTCEDAIPVAASDGSGA